MTDEETQDLRDWAARLMGWELYTPDFEDEWDRSSWTDIKRPRWWIEKRKWRPDDPSTGQIWLVVERMRELGYNCKLVSGLIKQKRGWRCQFWSTTADEVEELHINPCLAILKAARATGVNP